MNELTIINDLKSAIETINRYSGLSGFIFRGQSTGSWKLTPSIFRCSEKYIFVSDHLQKFKKYAIGRINDIEKYSDKEIWSIGQHFGLKTPLLDWTVSAAIALYFAFEERTENGEEYASLYALNAKAANKEFCTRMFAKHQAKSPIPVSSIDGSSVEKAGKVLVDLFDSNPSADTHLVDPEVESSLFRVFSPKRFNNPRLAAQRGLFSFSRTGKSIEEILEDNHMSHLLQKHLISIKIKNDIVRYLDTHNINPMSMYPDVSGAAKYANMKIARSDSEDDIELQTDCWL